MSGDAVDWWRHGRMPLVAERCSQPRLRLLQTIDWAPDTERASIQNVRVNHRRTDVSMAE
jgi:hypothetical protein